MMKSLQFNSYTILSQVPPHFQHNASSSNNSYVLLQILHDSDANFMFPYSDIDSGILLERDLDKFMVCGHNVPLDLYPECYMAG